MEQSTTTTPANVAGNLSELRLRLEALAPDALRAARSNRIASKPDGGFLCPPLCENWTTQGDHADTLGQWLALSLEIARLEQEQDALSGDQTEPLSQEEAFKLLAKMAGSDERGTLYDWAAEADQINRCRAAFAQSRGLLPGLEEDFESHVDDEVERMHRELSCITNRGRNQ
jgi:hypothetical protein